ncbi:tetratricopeptide repeat protein [Phenylobacterium sp.]|uniref:tetratricopeptide repeat protein n=1 Tax=Phenylobacterium sp. TaxID=1871053 RepID=UPI002F94A081
MTDLFEEVEEQLRSDRYRTLARKASPWVLAVLAAALIAALAWWGWTSWRDREAAKASEQYAAALDAFSQGDQTKAAQLWSDVAKSPSSGFKTLALMQLGGLQIADDKVQPAVAYFDQAAEAAPDEILADAARLKSALALLDTAPYAELEKRLNPLIEDGRPYRIQAREALGFAKLMKGDTTGARSDFLVVSASLDAPEGVRARAKAAIDLIDSGSAKALAATVKAAAALPRQQAPAGLLPPGALPPEMAAPPQAQPQAPGPQ